MSNKGALTDAWRFLTSMRLGIFLLAAVSASGVLGSLIPQREAASFYMEMYGPALVPLLLKFGLTDIFRSPWFIALSLLLGLNLAACTAIRFRKVSRRLCGPEWKNQSQIKKCSRYRELKVDNVKPQEAAQELTDMLKSHRYQVYWQKRKDTWVVAARRGSRGYIGSPLLHLALVIILAGSMVGGLYGKSATYQVSVPGKIQLTKDGFPFDLQVGNFKINYYPDGSPSQYRSQLTAIINDRPEREKTIAVNEPLSYQGVKVYQSSYGWMLAGSIIDGSNNNLFTVKNGDSLKLSGPGELTLEVNFLPDYKEDEAGRPYSRSERPVNPKVVYFLYDHGTPLDMGVTGINQAVQVAGMTIRFDRFNYFTGLIVKKDPGIPVIWTGFALLIAGLSLHFFVKPRCIWGIISPGENGLTVHLASEGIYGTGYNPEEEFIENLSHFSLRKECPA